MIAQKDVPTQERPCIGCGETFTACVATVMGVEIAEKICETCEERIQAEDKRQKRHMRLLRFASRCPVEFRESDETRFPAVWEQIKGWSPDSGRGIGLIDSAGRCKTRMLWAIGRRLALEGLHAFAMTHSELQALAQHQWTGDALDQIEKAKTCRVLILDDLGKGTLMGESANKLFSIIDHRAANRLPVLWTSNRSGDELAGMLDKNFAGPLLGRLADHCDVYTTDGSRLNKTS